MTRSDPDVPAPAPSGPDAGAPAAGPPDPSVYADGVYEMSADELDARRRGVAPPTLIDVREPWEYGVARIEGARLVPLGTLGAALSTFDPAGEYVLYCHHGVRSRAGADFLRERGLTRVANLTGGIDAWSTRVDAGVPRY